MAGKRPRHDDLILRLLESGRIVVKVDYEDTTVDCCGEKRPRTKIFVRDGRSRNGDLKEQTMFPNIVGHPYFSIYPNGRKGGMVWLSARRVVWYAFNPSKTNLMVCPIDGNRWNYNIWNLCLRDQNEENYIRMLNKSRPEEETEGEHSFRELADDLPF